MTKAMFKRIVSIEFWAWGLLSAFISGMANTLAAMVIAPNEFNIKQWKSLTSFALVSGVIGAAAYLKQSPLPKIEPITEDDVKEEVK